MLEPIYPKVLSVRRIPDAAPALLKAYGADPDKHRSLGLITCDQDDPTYVALDEATKHAAVDVVFAKSFYAGAGHASGPLSGEILGVIAASDPDEIDEGLRAIVRTLEHDACFYAASEDGEIAVFPHVIGSVGHYLAAEAGIEVGDAMAYLVAPPMEHTVALDAALKAADVEAVMVLTPPSETNFGAAFLKGSLADCEAAAMAYARAVIEVGVNPRER
ncbi:MAG: ethanolamine utilization microcompartment protein EutL [Proteobacteria bacterium]|nr:ethanolamine utilization microcompartment protein EutL [Pseudomonadota bacterium]MCP4919792.1 ethanolamine utilization microcompartment protein EutL [Pseudomonadota bacterium]